MFCSNLECPDFAATGLHGEYRDGITECPYCGKYLVESLPEHESPDPGPLPDVPQAKTFGEYEPPAADEAHEDLEPVFETSDPSEVPVVRSFLDGHGVPHVVVGGESFDAFRGSLSPFRFNPKAGVIGFLVPIVFAEIARDLLAEIEETLNGELTKKPV